MLAVERSAGVAPEVDLEEYTLHLLSQNKQFGRTHSGFETQRKRHQKSKTGVPVAPN